MAVYERQVRQETKKLRRGEKNKGSSLVKITMTLRIPQKKKRVAKKNAERNSLLVVQKERK